MRKCNLCGETISFVKTHKGNWMPVNPRAVVIYPVQKGGSIYITEDGYITRGMRYKDNAYYDGVDPIAAYEVHKATCGRKKRKE